ncbi:MAG: hypothetical protein K0R27_1367 [Xanthobacteraceae bacterium]|nr:hypothetical protein [Xanthobacteraceae bacterium]
MGLSAVAEEANSGGFAATCGLTVARKTQLDSLIRVVIRTAEGRAGMTKAGHLRHNTCATPLSSGTKRTGTISRLAMPSAVST